MDPRDPASTGAGRTTVAEATPGAEATPSAEAVQARRPHPLEPLSEEEIRATAATVRAHSEFAQGSLFVSTSLREPSKPALSEHELTGRPPARESNVVLYDKADSRWQEALRRRGVTDFTYVEVQPWPPGYADESDAAHGARVAKALSWVGRSETDNTFARPVEHVIATVDLDTAAVLSVEDHTGHAEVPLPPRAGNYAPELASDAANFPVQTDIRSDVRPIEISQPDGPSFVLDGHEIRWQKWHLVIGYTPREGLVLHRVRYLDGGRERSILDRASLSEMWVPYGDPAPVHRVKAVFDEGEAGLGALANPLQLGCDCLGEIRYLDAIVNDDDGEPVRRASAICIHEEDTGIGWKHTQYLSGSVEVRRGRRLVISSVATVGNYDYGFFWYLHTDGTIAYEVKLTGIISTGALADGAEPAHGTVVAPGLYGPHHQHFFNVRLDMAIDGATNSVFEVDAVPSPAGPDNPAAATAAGRPRAAAGPVRDQAPVGDRVRPGPAARRG